MNRKQFAEEYGEELAADFFDGKPADYEVAIGEPFTIECPKVVVIKDCDCHSLEEVAGAMEKILRVSRMVSMALTFHAHHHGSVAVFADEAERAKVVAEEFRQRGLEVELAPFNFEKKKKEEV